MKKVIALLVAILFLVMCSACSNNEGAFKSDDSGDRGNPVTNVNQFAVGGTITFGKYEQDNNLDNGPEPIEWIILDIQDGKALLLSKYGLDAKAYHTEYADITWEKCTLRAWLNGEFLGTAFRTDEQSSILTTKVYNTAAHGYSRWDTVGGDDTEDRIFLLSYTEANNYLGVKYWGENDATNNLRSRVTPTAYAIAQDAWTSLDYQTADGEPAGFWWLRSPGETQTFSAGVYPDGSLSNSNVNYDENCVRPALWINLKSVIF